jgi:hypothetical protein
MLALDLDPAQTARDGDNAAADEVMVTESVSED